MSVNRMCPLNCPHAAVLNGGSFALWGMGSGQETFLVVTSGVGMLLAPNG